MQTKTMWSKPLVAGSGSPAATDRAPGRAIAEPVAAAVAPIAAPASSWRRLISIGSGGLSGETAGGQADPGEGDGSECVGSAGARAGQLVRGGRDRQLRRRPSGSGAR